MYTVEVKDIIFGEGKPKVCVSMIGDSIEELIDEAQALKTLYIDLIEWRADFFKEVKDIEEVKKALFRIRKEIGEIPLLFTFRSIKEGGKCNVKDEYYLKLNKEIIKTGEIDIVDIELFNEEDLINRILEFAHEQGVKVIMSNHDFENTPSKKEIILRLCKMQDLGADLSKIAVMPNSAEDVLTLLDATNHMRKNFAKRPFITISMGNLGAISRLSGEVFGSCMTFGALKSESAPGQIEVKKLKSILEDLHNK